SWLSSIYRSHASNQGKGMALARKDVNLELEDRLIIEATIRGDRNAGRLLYERYQEQIWRVVRRLVPDNDEAMELCQETWLKAFSSLDKFRNDSRFSTWVLRIAINRVNSRSRWKKVRNHISV
ncbi:MAG: sigma-70 family RNA polymerase sigma factor, partial [Candidatus Omnitrophica bacterium]|nr:sigma-70 family RNA polymerase sigma factor [Candidatus Omnitrophota bacterium]